MNEIFILLYNVVSFNEVLLQYFFGNSWTIDGDSSVAPGGVMMLLLIHAFLCSFLTPDLKSLHVASCSSCPGNCWLLKLLKSHLLFLGSLFDLWTPFMWYRSKNMGNMIVKSIHSPVQMIEFRGFIHFYAATDAWNQEEASRLILHFITRKNGQLQVYTQWVCITNKHKQQLWHLHILLGVPLITHCIQIDNRITIFKLVESPTLIQSPIFTKINLNSN